MFSTAYQGHSQVGASSLHDALPSVFLLRGSGVREKHGSWDVHS